MLTLRNPKNPSEAIETSLTEPQMVEILKSLSSNFAQSLYSTYKQRYCLSPAQYYWAFKIAEESKPIPPVKLHSNLQEFVAHVPLLQFKVAMEDRTMAKVFLRTHTDRILVSTGFQVCGHIIGDEFFPTKKCPMTVKAELVIMSVDPMLWMQAYGKATGICCVCGRELTNEESVSLGIGPICRERFS